MTDWRYWITYSLPFTLDSDDESVARLWAAEKHAELVHSGSEVYLPQVEVEQVEGREGE